MRMELDDLFAKLYKRYSRQSWYAFFATLIIGTISHLFILTNELFNHDDLGSFFVAEQGVRPLRWMQSIFVNFVSPWGAPVLTGGLTILLIAVSVLFVVDTFQVQSKALAVIIGGIMVSSPIVASFMSYVEGSYLFVIGLPFAVLAFRWYEKGIQGYFAAILGIILATAGYQSLLAVTIACMFIGLFIKLLDEEWNIKEWLISLGKALSVLLLGLIAYIFSTKVAAWLVNGNVDGALHIGVADTELSVHAYEAQAEAGVLYLLNVVTSIINSVKQFTKFHFNVFFGGANQSPVSRYCVYANIVILFCVGATVCGFLVKRKKVWQRIFIVFTFVLAPICLNCTEVLLNGKASASLQMMYSVLFTVVFIVCILEKGNGILSKFKNIFIYLTFFGLVVNIYTNMQITNDAYMRMYTIYETAYSEMTRIIDRVEQLPEWQEGKRKIYFDYAENGGYLINENYQSFVWMDNYIDMGWCGVMGTGVYRFYGNNNTAKFVEAYFGIKFETPSEEEIMRLKCAPAYKKLQMFPASDSIKVINDVIVIRMDDGGGQ